MSLYITSVLWCVMLSSITVSTTTATNGTDVPVTVVDIHITGTVMASCVVQAKNESWPTATSIWFGEGGTVQSLGGVLSPVHVDVVETVLEIRQDLSINCSVADGGQFSCRYSSVSRQVKLACKADNTSQGLHHIHVGLYVGVSLGASAFALAVACAMYRWKHRRTQTFELTRLSGIVSPSWHRPLPAEPMMVAPFRGDDYVDMDNYAAIR